MDTDHEEISKKKLQPFSQIFVREKRAKMTAPQFSSKSAENCFLKKEAFVGKVLSIHPKTVFTTFDSKNLTFEYSINDVRHHNFTSKMLRNLTDFGFCGKV
eukprot:UN14823